METDLWKFEREAGSKGYRIIAGIDEAGRGPLAGPVVSAAVILSSDFSVAGIADSKKLTSSKRQQLYHQIYQQARSVGIGIVDAIEIDRINILRASLLSMSISVDNLDPRPDFLIVDGKFKIPADIPQQPVVKGDSLCLSIAAASIVAKVTRDKLMEMYHQEYPQFGFSRHKGYPTKAHKAAIKKYGCCPIHRKSFKGVKEHLPPFFPQTLMR
jgi:ribonuclease HII